MNAVNQNNGSISEAKIKGISGYHFFKIDEDSNSLRVSEFFNIGIGKLIPIEKVGFEARTETVRSFQKNFPRTKAFITSKKKKKDENQIFCTNSNCVATFSAEHDLDNHFIGQKHQYLDHQDVSSTADKIKVMLSQKLRECRLNLNERMLLATEQPSPSQPTNAGSQLNHEVTKHRFEDGNHMGWALRKRRKAMQFSEKQVELLVDMFMEGEQTNRKMDPLTVADMMRTAADKIGEKRFSTLKYLRHEQIASYFSRLVASKRKDGDLNSPDIDTVVDALPTAEEDEDLCDMEQCLEDMQADEEMMLWQDSCAPIANDPTNGTSSSTGSTTSQPKDQLKF